MVAAQMDLFSEVDKRQEILEAFVNDHPKYIELCRTAARRFAHLNYYGKVHGFPCSVCMDDVREALGIQTIKATDYTCNPKANNINGSVFRSGFVKVGKVPSKKEGGHGSEIKLWVPVDMIEDANRRRFKLTEETPE